MEHVQVALIYTNLFEVLKKLSLIILKTKLEMCQYDTDAPAQGPSSPRNKHFAKNEVEKGP